MFVDDKGKVRIVDLHCLVYYARHEKERFEKDAQYYHWDKLRDLFDDLGHLPAGLNFRFVRSAPLLVIPIAVIDFLYNFAEEEKNDRRRKKKNARANPKALQIGSSSKVSQLHSLALAVTSRNVKISLGGPPPPYSESSPLSHPRFTNRRLLVAKEPDPVSSASIVEL
jgi:hypothetical protein